MFGILVDKNGRKIKFDMLEELKKEGLKDGKQIIEKDWDIANSMNKPQWNGKKWIDVEPLPPIEPQEPQKTLEQQLEESNKRVVSVESLLAEVLKQQAKNTLLK